MIKNKRNLITRIIGLIISIADVTMFITSLVLSIKNISLEKPDLNFGQSPLMLGFLISQISLGIINGILILTSKYQARKVCGILTIIFSFVGFFFWIFTRVEPDLEQLINNRPPNKIQQEDPNSW